MRRNHKPQILNIKFIILIGIAAFLGVAIFNQQKIKSSPSPTVSPTPSPQLRPLPPNLTDDERFILNPPNEDASRSAKQQHAKTVAKLAKVGNTLELNDCQPTPLVLEVKQGSEFKIKNNDTTPINIIFDEEHVYKIPSNGDLEILAQFKYGPGDYGYVCDKVGLVGFLHIIP